MSTENYRIIKCPKCNKDFEAKFYSVIRGDIDIDLKEMIITQEIELLICPNCNRIFRYEDNFIYLDPKARIMAFVMPEYYKEKKEIVEKLKQDYKIIEGQLSISDNFNIEPVYLFGIKELINILLHDRDIEEESDVIEFIAREKKLKLKKIKRNLARDNDIAFVLPYKKNFEKNDILETLNEIFLDNNQLLRIKKTIEKIDIIIDNKKDFLDED